MANVQFFAPDTKKKGIFRPEEDAEVKRRRKLADAMMKAGEQPQGTEMVSGMAVKQSPLAGLARAIQQGVGGYQEHKADELETSGQQRRQEMMAEAIKAYQNDPNSAVDMLSSGDPAMQELAMKMGMGERDYQRELAKEQRGYANARSLKEMDGNADISGINTSFDRRERLAQIEAALNIAKSSNDFENTKKLELMKQEIENAPLSRPELMAQQMGVPAVPLNPHPMMTSKDVSKYAKSTQEAAQKKLNDPEMSEAASKSRSNINDASRFEELLNTQDTGGWRNAVPDALLSLDPQMSEMLKIQDRLAPQQRVPGSGASSDKDVFMFKNALPSVNTSKETNMNIIAAKKASERDVQQYQSFMSDFLQANGHLNGADAKWQEYVDANPIFDPVNATPENVVLNPNRKNYKEYFGGGQKTQSPSNPNDPVQAEIDAIMKELGLR